MGDTSLLSHTSTNVPSISEPMDEFSDILVPKKVAAKKPSGRGQEKACDKSTESKGKRIVKKEPEETIRVCFTQMSHLSKPELEMMKQVRNMKLVFLFLANAALPFYRM